MINYNQYITDEYHRLSNIYRISLQWVVTTVKEYCEYGPLTDYQIDSVTHLIHCLPVPVLPSKSGMGDFKLPADYDAEAFREAYKEVRRPEFEKIKQEYINTIKQLQK